MNALFMSFDVNDMKEQYVYIPNECIKCRNIELSQISGSNTGTSTGTGVVCKDLNINKSYSLRTHFKQKYLYKNMNFKPKIINICRDCLANLKTLKGCSRDIASKKLADELAILTVLSGRSGT